jgi:hypothetical protein
MDAYIMKKHPAFKDDPYLKDAIIDRLRRGIVIPISHNLHSWQGFTDDDAAQRKSMSHILEAYLPVRLILKA